MSALGENLILWHLSSSFASLINHSSNGNWNKANNSGLLFNSFHLVNFLLHFINKWVITSTSSLHRGQVGSILIPSRISWSLVNTYSPIHFQRKNWTFRYTRVFQIHSLTSQVIHHTSLGISGGNWFRADFPTQLACHSMPGYFPPSHLKLERNYRLKHCMKNNTIL